MNFKFYVIMNEKIGGGSTQYIQDSIPFYEIITKKNQLKTISTNSILIVQPLIDIEITIQDIIDYYKIINFKIVVPIHEWYWISSKKEICNNYSPYNFRHNLYLYPYHITEEIKEFFSICHKILCPSNFVFEKMKIFSLEKTIYSPWKDWDIVLSKKPNIFPIRNSTIRIGILHRFNIYKGSEEINEIRKRINKIIYKGKIYNIKYLITGIHIPFYKNNIDEYFKLIQSYKIHGLFHLNRWGETYCYSLTKSLLSGLPILYNNFGSFIERIPKDYDKYKIYHSKEKDYLKIDIQSLRDFFIYIIRNQSKTNIFSLNHPSKQIDDYWKKNFNFITIILTTTVFINPHKSMIFQRCPTERIKTYVKSIKQWIEKTNFHIIVVENSGYTFPEIDRSPRIEFITFQEKNLRYNSYIYKFHSKGWSECYSIQYAYKQSKFIKFSNFIFKITGRYFIPQLEEYLEKFKLNDYDSMQQIDDGRCELLGCHSKHFFDLFHLDFKNEFGKLDYHIENIYSERLKKYEKKIPSFKFSIDPTPQGGSKNIIDYL